MCYLEMDGIRQIGIWRDDINMKKKYPKWFSYYSQPYLRPEPQKPLPTFEVYHKVDIIPDFDRRTKASLMDVDFDFLEIEKQYDPYDSFSSSDIVLYKTEVKQKKPLTLKREMNAYLKDMDKWLKEKQEHEIRLKEWHELKKQWDDEEKANAERLEKAQLKKLKAKYE